MTLTRGSNMKVQPFRSMLTWKRACFKWAVIVCAVVSIHLCVPSSALAMATYFGDVIYSIQFPLAIVNQFGFGGPLLSSNGALGTSGSGTARFDLFTLERNFPSFTVGDGTAEGTTGPGVGTALSFSQATMGARL